MNKKLKPVYFIIYLLALLGTIGTFIYHSFKYFIIYDKISITLSIIGLIIAIVTTVSIRLSDIDKMNANIVVTCIFLGIVQISLLVRIILCHAAECTICMCTGIPALILLLVPAIIVIVKR